MASKAFVLFVAVNLVLGVASACYSPDCSTGSTPSTPTPITPTCSASTSTSPSTSASSLTTAARTCPAASSADHQSRLDVYLRLYGRGLALLSICCYYLISIISTSYLFRIFSFLCICCNKGPVITLCASVSIKYCLQLKFNAFIWSGSFCTGQRAYDYVLPCFQPNHC